MNVEHYCTMGLFALFATRLTVARICFSLEKKGRIRKKTCLFFPDCSEVKGFQLKLNISTRFSGLQEIYLNDKHAVMWMLNS